MLNKLAKLRLNHEAGITKSFTLYYRFFSVIIDILTKVQIINLKHETKTENLYRYAASATRRIVSKCPNHPPPEMSTLNKKCWLCAYE